MTLRIACVAGLGYPDRLGDEGLGLLAERLRERRVGLVVVAGVSSRPEPGLVEYVVSELVEGVEAAVAVLPGECDVAAREAGSSWEVLSTLEVVVRRAGGHPLFAEPLVTDGVGVAGAPVLRGGGCGGLERWGLPGDVMEDFWGGRLARHYRVLVEEYRPRRVLLVVGGGGTPLLVGEAIAAMDGRVRLLWAGECSEPLEPLVLSL